MRIYSMCIFITILLILSLSTIYFKFQYAMYVNFVVLMIFFILMVSKLIFILKNWKTFHFNSFIPFMIAAIFFVIYVFLFNILTSRKQTEEIQLYKQVVNLIDRGEITVNSELSAITIPAKYNGKAYKVLAMRDENNTITVEFLIGKGYPLKHNGLLYRSNGKMDDVFIKKRWRNIRQINKKWFRISD